MTLVETKILNIIKDIKNCSKETSQDLFTRLVSERLNKAVESYYDDLSYNFSMYGNNEKKLSNELKGLIK